MARQYCLGLAQMGSIIGDTAANAARIRHFIDEARQLGVDLLVFPELALTGYRLGPDVQRVAIPAPHPLLSELARSAGEMVVVLGFVEEDARYRVYNSVAWLADGKLQGIQRKLYLPNYGIFDEGKFFSPGQGLQRFDGAWGRTSVLICADAWQPALAFIAVQSGAVILLHPASSAEGILGDALDVRTAWEDLNRTYARIFETYVVFVNRVGSEGDLRFWGGSEVIDPRGRVVAKAPYGEETLLTARIDLGLVRTQRQAVPLVAEARLALIRREIDRLIDEGGDL